jgi:pimeloyl-ACP methyl ester carboxylesterase
MPGGCRNTVVRTWCGILLFSSLLPAQQAPRPVLFVHGASCAGAGPQSWEYITGRLVEDGWSADQLYTPPFDDSAFSCELPYSCDAVPGIAVQIFVAAWQARAQTFSLKVDLVGHSLGGPATLYFVKYFCGSMMVGNYVGMDGSYRLMSCSGEVEGEIQDLLDCDQTPVDDILYTSFSANNPARLQGARNITTSENHFRILTSATVYDQVRAALLGGGRNHNHIDPNRACYETTICTGADPSLKGLNPSVLHRGQARRVNLKGNNLRLGAIVGFSAGGVRVESIEPKGENDKRLRTHLSVAPDAPLGPQDVLLVNMDGSMSMLPGGLVIEE